MMGDFAVTLDGKAFLRIACMLLIVIYLLYGFGNSQRTDYSI